MSAATALLEALLGGGDLGELTIGDDGIPTRKPRRKRQDGEVLVWQFQFGVSAQDEAKTKNYGIVFTKSPSKFQAIRQILANPSIAIPDDTNWFDAQWTWLDEGEKCPEINKFGFDRLITAKEVVDAGLGVISIERPHGQ
jgi:hypothetical protein